MAPCYRESLNPRKNPGLIKAVIGGCSLLLLSGCSSVGYLLQAAQGEIRVLHAAQPIAQTISDPHTPARIRRELQRVRRIRRFAIQVLHLPDNGSFRDYANLHRRYALWNVFAAPAFSVHLTEWCFPIAGCVPYRGYFSKRAAEQYAASLARRGDDVYVAGVPSFSTLGWLKDPFLSTELYRSRSETAGLIFHELAHALLYVPGDPVFNESFAVTVQRSGVLRWLRARGHEKALRRYVRRQRFDAAFASLIRRYRSLLARSYRETPPGPGLLRRKQRLFGALASAIVRTARCLGERVTHLPVLNNASLGAMSTYTRFVPAFRAILKAEGGHFSRFYRVARRISHWPRARRDAWLRSKLPVRESPHRCAGSGHTGKRAGPAPGADGP
ncbi:MAG: aminopeptidase [Acidiferrobacteraceae bacterium]